MARDSSSFDYWFGSTPVVGGSKDIGESGHWLGSRPSPVLSSAAAGAATVALAAVVMAVGVAQSILTTRVPLQAVAEGHGRVVANLGTRVPLQSTVRASGRVAADLSSRIALGSIIRSYGRLVPAQPETRTALRPSIVEGHPRLAAQLTAFVAAPLQSTVRTHGRVVTGQLQTRIALAAVAEGRSRVVATLRTSIGLTSTVRGHGRVVATAGSKMQLASVVRANSIAVSRISNLRINLIATVYGHPRAQSNLEFIGSLHSVIIAHGYIAGAPLFVGGVCTGRTGVSIIAT